MSEYFAVFAAFVQSITTWDGEDEMLLQAIKTRSIKIKTIVAGIFTIFLSRLLKYFRPLFPVEVCGVAVLMLGISMVGPAVTRVLGLHGNTAVDPLAVAVAFITLVVTVGFSVYLQGKGLVGMLPILFGAIVLSGAAVVFSIFYFNYIFQKKIVDSASVSEESEVSEWE